MDPARREKIDALVLSTLPKAGAVGAAVYAAMAAIGAALSGPRSIFPWEDAALALLWGGLALAARASRMPPRAANAVVAGLLTLGALRIAHQAAAMGVAAPPVPILLVMAAMGALVLSWPALLAGLCAALLAAVLVPGTLRQEGVLLALAGAAGLASLIHLARIGLAAGLLELQEREAVRSRALAEAHAMARIARWDWDGATRSFALPPECRALYGIGPGEPLDSLALLRRTHPEDRARVKAEVEAALASPEPFTVRHRIVRDDGVRHLVVRGQAVLDAQGRPAAVWGVSQDVTDATMMSETLRRQERLSALGTLVAGVAHEINNPLAYMLGAVDLTAMDLEEMRADPAMPTSVARRLAAVQERQAMLAKGIDELASLSRSLRQVAKQGAAERGPVEIASLVEDVLRVAAPRIPPGVDVATRFDRRPTVHASRGEISQVLLNLVLNAADAMRAQARGSLLVRVEERDGAARIRVRDTGPGVRTEDRPRIFTPFFTTKPDGTGLGLSISHSIVEAHGGRIAFESEPGRGTEFVVDLPGG
ncbi:MAG TPA: ATP-binding protein [Candidatus Thermoplasmatota archaeon]|nr:ATP-binding protein [Candidatus Thermoplasmatota archaeon]